MRIVLAGGGTGGHFTPLIAVAEQIKTYAAEQKLLGVKLYFVSPTAIDKNLLLSHQIEFVPIIAGKKRMYKSFLNIIDYIKTPFALIQALYVMLRIYPDVVFSKGGYGAFPVVFAARVLFIPVVMHESDTVPGRVNAWTGKFAKRIAISYPEAAKYFPLDKVAHTGQPLQTAFIEHKAGTPPFKLDESIPTIFVIGGSLGSQIINGVVIESLPQLLPQFQVIHQTGANNFESSKMISDYLIADSEFKNRYIPLSFLDAETINTVLQKSSLVITRAGSTLFEIAQYEKPSIIIPIAESNGNHQRKNAFAFARAGAGSVIEEHNLTSHIVVSEISRIMNDSTLYDSMKNATKDMQTPDASRNIAEEIIKIGSSH